MARLRQSSAPASGESPSSHGAARSVTGGISGLALALVISLRPWQWVKNSVIFFPFIFTLDSSVAARDFPLAMANLARSGAGIIIFCLLSGAVYLINDLADRERDKVHERKSRRPIASGALPVPVATLTAGALVVASLVAAVGLHLGFALICGGYFLLNLGYSLRLKSIVLLDVMIVASGYVLRLAGGSALLELTTSPWLYMMIGQGALLLILGKRLGELNQAGENSSAQSQVVGEYTIRLLQQLVNISAASTLLAYGLYIFTADNLPANGSMFLTIPFVIFGLFRYLYLVEVRGEGETPELLMVKDLPLILTILLWGATGLVFLILYR